MVRDHHAKCSHGKRRDRCAACGGSALCYHGKRKERCVLCRPPAVHAITSKPARGRLPPHAVWLSGLGYMSTPELVEASALRKRTSFSIAVVLPAHHPTLPMAIALPLRPTVQRERCASCLHLDALAVHELPPGVTSASPRQSSRQHSAAAAATRVCCRVAPPPPPQWCSPSRSLCARVQ